MVAAVKPKTKFSCGPKALQLTALPYSGKGFKILRGKNGIIVEKKSWALRAFHCGCVRCEV